MRIVILFLSFVAVASLSAIEIKQKPAAAGDIDQVVTADAALQQADSVFRARNYEAALTMYEQAVSKAKEAFDNSIEVEASSQVARMNLILGNKENGRKWLSEATLKATDSNPMGWSRYLGVKGRFEWKDDSLAAARRTFEAMHKYCNSNALWDRAVDAAHMVAIVAKSPEDQIEWNRFGIEAAEAGDIGSWLGPLWNNLAATYYDLKQYDSSLACYLRARDAHWQFSGEVSKLFADYQVGMAYRLAGQPDEAVKWLRPSLAWAERLGNHSAIGQTCEDLGEIELAKGNKTAALKLFKRTRNEYKAAGFDTSWVEIYEGITKRIAEVQK